MIRRETSCKGRLVKEIAQINVGGAATNFRDHYIDGPHRWLLDGEHVTELTARAFLSSWNLTDRMDSHQGATRRDGLPDRPTGP
ncbi:hypothetical protein [Streptomyces sp. NPDC055058]